MRHFLHKKSLISFSFVVILLLAAAFFGLYRLLNFHVATNNLAANRPIALIYRDDKGESGCDGCAEAAAHMLMNSSRHFSVRYVGPGGEPLTASLLQSAALYVQPGGGQNVDGAYAELKGYAPLLKAYLRSGGRYLGLCMGGYLAGSDPGFDLLPGDSNEYITSPGSTVHTPDDTVIDVRWRGTARTMYFQDGPYYTLQDGSKDATVLARYTNGQIAVMVAAYGKGKVGVSGPHVEATADWYDQYHLPKPANLNTDLANDLLNTVMG